MPKKELIASYPQRAWAQGLSRARVGTPVKEVYLCTDPPQDESASDGQKFLSATVYDVTGGVEVKVFPERVADCKLEPGKTVELEGTLRRGKGGSWWVVAKTISEKPIEDIEMVTPVVYCPIEDLDSDLETYAGLVEKGSVYWRLLALFLDDEEFRERLRLAAKSDYYPFSYVGGVLERAVNLTRIVQAKCEGDPGMRSSLLLVSSILQGIGAMEAYDRQDGRVVVTGKGLADREVFIVREAILMRVLAHNAALKSGEEPIDIDSKEYRAVIHCITAAHGTEFLPDTGFGIPEAEVVHNAAKV